MRPATEPQHPADAQPHTADAPLHTADAPLHTADAPDAPWWRDAVIYQIYPRSWADADGDGLGDLPGITARLPYLRDLGVDAVWLSPFYVSPMNDAGYDVASYRDVDPIFGTLADADRLVATAHDLGLRVLVDLVPNHTSSEHPWFQAALKSGRGSTERDRYVFREGRGPHGDLPPNNWPSVFGGRGWSRVTEPDGTPGQWYLHIFDTTQPDLNWHHPEVREAFEEVLRFWCDRGVDGFRVDVAHGLVKAEGLPDWDLPIVAKDYPVTDADGTTHTARPPMWDQDGVHEIYRAWRAVLDSYAVAGADRDRILCAEAWVQPEERLARYVRPDEFHQAFNFDFLDAPWQADALRRVVTESYEANDGVGAMTTWVLSNHDVVRHASRLALPPVGSGDRPGIGADDPQPDAVLGLRRARAATLLMLALPGGAYLYQGEELGLPEHTTMPDEYRQDPIYHRTKGTEHPLLGRDGCRVPMPWRHDAPSLGFGPSERTWLPQPAAYSALAVDRQDGVPGSTLELYRAALRTRREACLGHGSLTWLDQGPDVVAFVNASADGTRRMVVVTNLGDASVPLPAGHVALSSGDLDGDTLPTDTTVWLEV